MKKVILFLKKYQLIIGLALIAGLIISYRLLFSSSYQPEPAPFSSLSPSPFPLASPTPKTTKKGKGISEKEFGQEIKNKFPLSPYLPYPGPELAIRYLAPLKLQITIKQGATNSALLRKKALDWIRSQGVDPQTHEIIWK